MRKLLGTAGAAVAFAIILGGFPTSQVSAASDPVLVGQGKDIALDRKKGNCLACHAMDGGDLPGNIGPPLVAMEARFPDKERLRAQIWDPTAANPNTMMPPFGLHGILTEDEIDKVTEYIHTL